MNMVFKMTLAPYGLDGKQAVVKRLARSAKVRLFAKLECCVPLEELGDFDAKARALLSRGEMNGDWLVSVKGWEVVGKPTVALSPGEAEIKCKIRQQDPVDFFMTQAGMDKVKAAAVTAGATAECESQYRRQVAAGRDLVFGLQEVAEHSDTEWTLTLQPMSLQGELPISATKTEGVKITDDDLIQDDSNLN